jgi:hypothetical protein
LPAELSALVLAATTDQSELPDLIGDPQLFGMWIGGGGQVGAGARGGGGVEGAGGDTLRGLVCPCGDGRQRLLCTSRLCSMLLEETYQLWLLARVYKV